MTHTSPHTTQWSYVLDEPVRILVVDDDPILREFAGVHLATPSTTIDTARNGTEALQRIHDNPYDVILLDIEMPQMDGFAVLERIRAHDESRRVAVIMLTSHDDIASIDRAYRYDVSSFATKPVNWRQLSYQIRDVVRAARPGC